MAPFTLEQRIETFKSWPFPDTAKCNVKAMAQAGFYSIATGEHDADAAKCLYCGKELDGWESTDDPWAEHRSHSANCCFVKMGKKEDDLLLSEFLELCRQSSINMIREETERAKQRLLNKLKRAKERALLSARK